MLLWGIGKGKQENYERKKMKINQFIGEYLVVSNKWVNTGVLFKKIDKEVIMKKQRINI